MLYRNLPAPLSANDGCEINRLALHRHYRASRRIFLALLRAVCDQAFQLAPIAYTTAGINGTSAIYKRLGLHSLGHPPFKYHADDEEHVEILYFDTRTASPHVTLLYKLTDHLCVNYHESKMEL